MAGQIHGFEVDPLIQVAVLSIKDSKDFEMLALLIDKGPLAFSNIKETLQIAQTTLHRKVTRLMNAALINHYYAKTREIKTYSYYEATNLAKKIFAMLLEIQQPRPNLFLENPYYVPGSEIESIQEDLTRTMEKLDKVRRQMQGRRVAIS